MINMYQVAFIIVNYNTADLLKTCLESIQQHSVLNYAVVIVDNNSTDNSCQIVKEQFPAFQLIQNSKNVGFPEAVNQGIKAIDAPYYFILNSDIILLENTTSILYQYMSQTEKIGIVAPAQILPNGDPILSVYDFPNLKREWLRNLFFTDVLTYRIQNQKRALKINKPVSVDWVMGAALFVRNDMILDIGLMDETIFMYGEELDWCIRAHLREWHVDFNPEAKIIHYQNASAQKAFNTNRYQQVVKSNYYVFAKHFGGWQLPFFVMAQCLGSLLRIIISVPPCIFQRKDLCDQIKEHLAVIQISMNPNLYKWIREVLD